MPDRRYTRLSLRLALRQALDAFLVLFGWPTRATRDAYEEVLRQLNQNQSLDQLLGLAPFLCEALSLASFHIFLFHGDAYILQPVIAEPVTLPASSSTVLRMKREHRAAYVASGPYAGPGTSPPPDGWQLLATPHELEIFRSLQTELLVPLDSRTRLAGFASLSRPQRRTFTRYEKRFLRTLGIHFGRALETALFLETLSSQAVERTRALHELELAREVQSRLLPVTLPELPGLAITALYQSAEQVGGDYYDAFLTPAGHLCSLVADVSGKGISAALVMSSLRATLHTLMLQPGLTVPAILAHCNALLYQASSASRYATLFFSIYDPAAQTLTYINAGHNPPLLRCTDGSIRRLTTGGPVIGLLPSVSFVAESIAFHPGETLLAFTDGVTEAINERLEEWQESGLLEAWRAWPSQSGEQLVTYLLHQLKAFTQSAPQNDDITLLVLHRTSNL